MFSHNIVQETSDEASVSSLDDDVVNGPFVSRIVHEASQSIVSIPRCLGVHDLHLDSSKALLDGTASAALKPTPLLPRVVVQENETVTPVLQYVEGGDVPATMSADGVGDVHTAKSSQTEQFIDSLAKSTNTMIIESITHIIDYDNLLGRNETTMRMTPASGRVETLGSAQSVGLTEILARKSTSRPSSVSLRGTWSRIKKAFSSISGRSQLHLPNS